jgi:hypothetical protein
MEDPSAGVLPRAADPKVGGRWSAQAARLRHSKKGRWFCAKADFRVVVFDAFV